MSFIKSLFGNRAANFKVAQQLQKSEFKNESVEFVLHMLLEENIYDRS